MSEIKRDDKKLRELLLYVSARAEMGSTKLNKILFHAEFQAYRDLGHPITGHPYVKRVNGPAPRDLRPIRKNLEVDESARVESIDVGAPHPEDRIVPLRDADISIFSERERAIIDDVIQKFRSFTGTALADETHTIPGWRAAEMNAEIPYVAAFISGRITNADRYWGRRMAAAYGWP